MGRPDSHMERYMVRKSLFVAGLAALSPFLGGCIIVADNSPDYRKPTPQELASVRTVAAGESLPSVREKYATQLAKLEPGMTVSAFREAIPEATFIEQRTIDGAPVDAYSLTHTERYRYHGGTVILTHEDEKWFYFRNGQFVKWGEPGVWPLETKE